MIGFIQFGKTYVGKSFQGIFLISLILFNARLDSQAQFADMGPSAGTDIFDLIDKTNSDWVLNQMGEDINGSPYLNDEFEKGEILLSDSTLFSDALLRYNIYNDQIEFQHKGKEYAIGVKHLLNRISLGEDIFVVEMYESGVQEQQGYFILLAEGKVNLLYKMEMELTDRVPSKPMRDPEPRKFVRQSDDYYVKYGRQRIYEIGSLKKLISYLEEHQEEMKTFAKKEKISAKKRDDLTKFINYFNSL